MLRKPLILRSSKLAKRRRRVLYIKVAAIVFVVASFVGVPAYLLSQPEVTIHQISISGNEIVPTRALEALAWKELKGKYAYVYPRSNSFIFPRSSIEASVLESYKRIKNARVSFDSFTSIHLQVEERTPFALWCRESIELVNVSEIATSTEESTSVGLDEHTSCYFLDREGFIFSEAPRFTGTVYFVYEGAVNEDDPVGVQFIPEEEFTQLTFLVDALRASDAYAVKLAHTDDGDFELILKEGGKLIFGGEQSLSLVLDNFNTALTSDTFSERSVDEVEYIDLRFGNRVYYKFKEE